MENQQIGWSVEAKLLYAIAKELERLAGLIKSAGGGNSGGTAGSAGTQIAIVTSTAMSNTTTDVDGTTQDGKNVIIDNGASAITYTINGPITASFMKVGTGNVTFVAGAGRTLVTVDGTAVLSGAAGSTATIVSYGTTDYLKLLML